MSTTQEVTQQEVAAEPTEVERLTKVAAEAHAETVTRHTPTTCRGSRLAPSIVKARSHWGMILTVPTTPTLVPDASLRVTGRGDGVPVG